MKNNTVGEVTSVIANGGAIMGISGGDSVTQLIGIIVAILSGVMSIAYTGYKWYKLAKSENSDGGSKITMKEVEDGFKEVIPAVKEVVESIKEAENNGNNDK